MAVLTKGQIFGGDSGFTYTGKYEADDNSFRARVAVSNFLPDVPSIFGLQGDYELSLAGTVDGHVIRGKAVLVGQAGVGIVVRLTKRKNLP